MNITLTSLEALILKGTSDTLRCPDPAAIEAFCAVMKDSGEGPQLAAQALAARVHSQNPKEALLALIMLDKVMKRGDANFIAEIGKFRFLNELIKLVSPKYDANRTASEIKLRILQLFHSWSVDYPKESKFKAAYEMLRNQGVLVSTPPPMQTEEDTPKPRRTTSVIFQDEEKTKMLQKLLQSKKPEDLRQANKLIKTMVKEDERRSEENSRRAQEVSAALYSAGLLRDMLAHARNATRDETQLIHELHTNCLRQLPALEHLALVETDDDTLKDILQASDTIDSVCKTYNAYIKSYPEIQEEHTDSLLDFAGAKPETDNGVVKKNAMDELGEIFSEPVVVEPLKPVNVSDTKCDGPWKELDSLGEQLLKQSLPDNARRQEGFNGKTTKKIPMNALEKSSPKHMINNNDHILDLDFFMKKPENNTEKLATPKRVATPGNQSPIMMATPKRTTPTPKTDDFTLLTNQATSDFVLVANQTSTTNNESSKTTNQSSTTNNQSSKTTNQSSKPNNQEERQSKTKDLSNIDVSLSNVKPSKIPPLTIFDEVDGLSVKLHFCEDKPRPDVYVMVISTTSRKSCPVEDFKFQPYVPKGCKVRTLTPSSTSLPPFSPFLPPPAMTQLLLITRPQNTGLRLKFLISYTCDEDTCSEIGETQELPLDDI